MVGGASFLGLECVVRLREEGSGDRWNDDDLNQSPTPLFFFSSLVRAPSPDVPYGPEQEAVAVPARPGGRRRLLQEKLLARRRASAADVAGRPDWAVVIVVEQHRLDVEHGFSDEGDGSRRVPLAEAHEGSQPAALAGVFARVLLAECATAGWLSIRP